MPFPSTAVAAQAADEDSPTDKADNLPEPAGRDLFPAPAGGPNIHPDLDTGATPKMRADEVRVFYGE
jgi:hypothetical protein